MTSLSLPIAVRCRIETHAPAHNRVRKNLVLTAVPLNCSFCLWVGPTATKDVQKISNKPGVRRSVHNRDFYRNWWVLFCCLLLLVISIMQFIVGSLVIYYWRSFLCRYFNYEVLYDGGLCNWDNNVECGKVG